ncbi:hypothetical protein V1498_11585 [Peribacillus sp. SCS-26]|uniref:hypothetical protein n=1 Tax=Paraperibacillus marinus TaxID=3115295 RepID=UPI00390665A1
MKVGRVQYGGYDITARSTLMLLIDLLFETNLKTGIKQTWFSTRSPCMERNLDMSKNKHSKACGSV